jgi:small-conductance mechanosensitive channel
MPAAPVTNWGDAIITSVSAALAMFLGAIPRVIGFLIILVIGWMVASAIAAAVTALLRSVNFNGVAQRSGFSGFVQSMGVRQDASEFLANVAKWFIRLIVLVVAFDALGLPAVSEVLQQLLLWLPNLVVAMVILVVAGLAANALHGLVRGATASAGFGNPDLLANIARVAVWAFAVVVAVNQLGIATTLVNTLFTGTVGALALALGLAFGLGGRETAGEIVNNWYRKGQQAAPKMAEAAENVRDQAQSQASSPSASASPSSSSDRSMPSGERVSTGSTVVRSGDFRGSDDASRPAPLRTTQND